MLLVGPPVGVLPFAPSRFRACPHGVARAVARTGRGELLEHFAQTLWQRAGVADQERAAGADALLETALLEIAGHQLPSRAPARAARSAGPRRDGFQSRIAEGNLVGLLSELGVTWSRDGQALLPIGTLYDPFVNRALEPWSFGMYAGAQSILIGTPSGVTLAPEGGAHQSIITPSVGLEQPRCIAWEPAFGQDLEWTLLYALSRLGRPDGTSSYFRLSMSICSSTCARS